MKIAYGTYATPMLPLDEALRMIAGIGYDGVEICISPKHSSMPEELDSAKRRQLKDMLSELNLGVPSLFTLGSVLTEDEEAHKGRLELTSQVMELARDLGIGDHPVAVGIIVRVVDAHHYHQICPGIRRGDNDAPGTTGEV